MSEPFGEYEQVGQLAAAPTFKRKQFLALKSQSYDLLWLEEGSKQLVLKAVVNADDFAYFADHTRISERGNKLSVW
jgi:hypothetical protein